MQTLQQTLFNQKKYSRLLPPTSTITPPTPECRVLTTLAAYHTYLSSGKYSKYTPDDFTGDIKRFGFFVQKKKLKDIQPVDLQQWIAELKKMLTTKTVSRKISALNNYFVWLQQEHVLPANPMEGISTRRVTSPLPDILFAEECQKLFQSASADPRSYLLLLLLLETGITMEELTELKVQHFDFSNHYAPEMWVKHTDKKVRKDRKLKIPVETNTVFPEYLQQYKIAKILFPYTPQGIRLIISHIAANAGVKKKVSPQILRDTCAVRLLKSGESIETVLKKLGLRETTWEDAKEKYLKLTSRAL